MAIIRMTHTLVTSRKTLTVTVTVIAPPPHSIHMVTLMVMDSCISVNY